jgi:hypothetical protein
MISLILLRVFGSGTSSHKKFCQAIKKALGIFRPCVEGMTDKNKIDSYGFLARAFHPLRGDLAHKRRLQNSKK